MRILVILIMSVVCQGTLAHNMTTELKKDKIIEALDEFTQNINHHDITITANPLSLDYSLQMSRLDSGDKDIDKVLVSSIINGEKHRISCDMLSGEYGDARATYFIIYENCELINLDSFKVKSIELSPQTWDDWRY